MKRNRQNSLHLRHQAAKARYEQLRRRTGLVPLMGLFIILLLALGLAGYLIPRQSELVNRLVQDGRHDRALALVGEGVIPGGNTLEDPSPATLVQVLIDSIDHDFDVASRERIDALVRITEDPAGVYKVLMDRRRVIPREILPELLDHLAVRAVQAGNPALAVSLYADLDALSPLTLDQTRASIAASRFANQPRTALDAVSRYLAVNQMPFTQLPEDLRKLTVSLHRELNEGSVAFDLLSEEFKATLDPAERHELVELITTVAAQSARLTDSLPLLEDFLASTDAGQRGWRELFTRETKAENDADFLQFGKMLAQNLEWNNRTSEAFDLNCKLAAMGDVDALDRCVTIYPWVDRQGDTTDLLEVLVPVVGRDRYTLLLARLQAERGKFSEAEAIYREALAGAHSEEASLWNELGDILDAQDRFEEARDIYQTALSLDEGRHDIRIHLARIFVTLGDHSAALAEYQKIPVDAHDRKTREDYAMIAHSLGATEDFIKAIQLKLAAEPTSEAGSILDIADAWESLADLEALETTLRDGLKRFPDSAAINLRLADHLTKLDQKDDAFDLLAKCSRTADKRFASRLLSLGYDTARYVETLGLVSGENVKWSPSERFDLASLHEETGNLESALAQYRLAEGGESGTARIEAELAYNHGDLATALRRHRDFLDMLTTPDYEAWTFYGDIYQAAGRTADAEEAYKTALEQLKIQLTQEPEVPGAQPAVATSR